MKEVLSIAAAAADVCILTSILREVLLHSFYGG
jgi:hypothetical protein